MACTMRVFQVSPLSCILKCHQFELSCAVKIVASVQNVLVSSIWPWTWNSRFSFVTFFLWTSMFPLTTSGIICSLIKCSHSSSALLLQELQGQTFITEGTAEARAHGDETARSGLPRVRTPRRTLKKANNAWNYRSQRNKLSHLIDVPTR